MEKGDKSLVERIKAKREERAAMIKHFGFMPMSILRIGRANYKLFVMQHETPAASRNYKTISHDGIAIRKRQVKQDKNTLLYPMGSGKEINTVMPASLVEFFLKYYTQPGSVYLDPFAGQGIQMQMANIMGRHYYGYDICKDFFDYMVKVKEKITEERAKINIYYGDSRYPDNIPDNIGDFCFTSPPYWNIEHYDDNPAQLGNDVTYEEFIMNMYKIAKAWLPKFKAGAYCVINVNDFRKDAVSYPFHADLIKAYQKAGWIYWDIWIVESVLSSLLRIFARQANAQKRAPKLHEYAIVFRKANDKECKSGIDTC